VWPPTASRSAARLANAREALTPMTIPWSSHAINQSPAPGDWFAPLPRIRTFATCDAEAATENNAPKEFHGAAQPGDQFDFMKARVVRRRSRRLRGTPARTITSR
jgi:hypothetical protein